MISQGQLFRIPRDSVWLGILDFVNICQLVGYLANQYATMTYIVFNCPTTIHKQALIFSLFSCQAWSAFPHLAQHNTNRERVKAEMRCGYAETNFRFQRRRTASRSAWTYAFVCLCMCAGLGMYECMIVCVDSSGRVPRGAVYSLLRGCMGSACTFFGSIYLLIANHISSSIVMYPRITVNQTHVYRQL